MKLNWRLLVPFAILTLTVALTPACGDDDDDTTTDAGTDVSDMSDQQDPTTDPVEDPVIDTVEDPVPDVVEGWERPEGSATLWIAVDDTANETYEDGQLIWKGSFTYAADTNILTYDGSWGMGAGPYVPLYDDGPWTDGGHEATGQTAGDHILTAEVFFMADPDNATTIEYGMENETGWIWSGANGSIEVPAASTDTFEVTGMTIAPHGTIDFMLTIDLNSLHGDFDGVTGPVFVKGTFNGWATIELFDDGEAGDAAADDGIFTMQRSENLGAHDGLAELAEEIQFVFVFNSADGLEYKSGNDALAEGVAAFSDYETPGTFVAEDVLLIDAYPGLNTAIIIGVDPTE